MDKLYFSENNIAAQTKKLILNLELPDQQINRDVVLKCTKIISEFLSNIFILNNSPDCIPSNRSLLNDEKFPNYRTT